MVLESTTYPGTTEEVFLPILEAGSGLRAGADFHVGYSPERIDPSNPTWGLRNTPKIVSGIDEASSAAVAGFYGGVVDRVVPAPGTREAELAKLLENTFRHVNIALVNELAIYCHELGIDVWSVIDMAATKPFGFMKFTPGPGVGGHCLPIDPSYLSWQVRRALGRTFRFVEIANDVNDNMPGYVVTRVIEHLNRRRLAVNGSRILLVGLTYKRNSGDARQSPATMVARRLVDLGAQLRAVDPLIPAAEVPAEVRLVDCTPETLAETDLVVVLADHDDVDWELLEKHADRVLDTPQPARQPGRRPAVAGACGSEQSWGGHADVHHRRTPCSPTPCRTAPCSSDDELHAHPPRSELRVPMRRPVRRRTRPQTLCAGQRGNDADQPEDQREHRRPGERHGRRPTAPGPPRATRERQTRPTGRAARGRARHSRMPAR